MAARALSFVAVSSRHRRRFVELVGITSRVQRGDRDADVLEDARRRVRANDGYCGRSVDWVAELWLEELWSAHAGQVFAYVARRTSRREAEDLVAEVFAIAVRQRGDHPHPSRERLYRIAGRVVDGQTGRAGADRTHFKGISLDDWEVLWLAVWEGLEPREAARALGVTGFTSRLRLWRAQRRLKVALNRTSLSDLLQRSRIRETDHVL
ncbi:MAG: sigma-70 family RNA polymerase sigma factor [bacterium]|nr:sigma-70 family RNA polymerase sigma factor [bacterium]